jgi:alpha-glucosidase (family GH31 glycosyl hydrolase)
MKGYFLIILILSLIQILYGLQDETPNAFYVTDVQDITNGYKFTLGNHHATSESTSAFGVGANNFEILNAVATIERVDTDVYHFLMQDSTKQRWIVPEFNPGWEKQYSPKAMDTSLFKYTKDPFEFQITDQYSKQVAFSTMNTSLKFYNFYLEIGIAIETQRIFGLGEHNLQFNIPEGLYTIFGMGQPNPYADGKGGHNLYGQQPFYLVQVVNQNIWHGCFIRTTNAQDVYIQFNEDGSSDLYHKIVGGIFDIFFFMGPSPEHVIQKYHTLIGKPYLPPFWALGYHQCRWGYTTIQKMQTVITSFKDLNWPIDAIWNDIDYMVKYEDFTIDNSRYPGFLDWIMNLHHDDIHYIPIVDAGIGMVESDDTYQQGLKYDTYIKSARTGKTLVGKVWPGFSVFVDFFNPNGPKLWKEGLEKLYKLVAFDGLWLDMNECENFCNGECFDAPQPPVRAVQESNPNGFLRGGDENPFISTVADGQHDFNEFDDLPYLPGGRDLNTKALSMSGYHYSGGDAYKEQFYKEFYLHPLWNFEEQLASYQYQEDQLKRRNFIISRSNFAGSGMHSSIWLGDNFSKWEFMRWSIPGVFNYQLFGIPIVGADMCGFLYDTTDELCARWLQLGAFQPFSRNHNNFTSTPQEPYAVGPLTKEAFPKAFRQRYSILRYYYTNHFESCLNGGTVVRPLFFLFPEDDRAYDQTQYTFLIGNALLVSAELFPDTTSHSNVIPYFPNANWYNLESGKILNKYIAGNKYGNSVTLNAPYNYVNVQILGGQIIPYQDAEAKQITRAVQLFYIPVTIIVAVDQNEKASGTMAIDDGVSTGTLQFGNYRYYTFTFENKRLSVSVKNSIEQTYTCEYLSTVKFYGLGTKYNGKYINKGNIYDMTVTYDEPNDVLTLTTDNKHPWYDIGNVFLE